MMLDYLRRLAAAVMHRRRPFHPFNPPSDPYVGVREPRRPTPGGRSSAVAVEEPPPSSRVRAVGRNTAMVLAIVVVGAVIASAQEKPFVSGGKIDVQLSGGDYNIVPAADNRIRVTLKNGGATKVDISASGSSATVKISNTPSNMFSATIEVPKVSDISLHLSGGDLTIAEIAGNKDIDAYAGDVTIAVGDPKQYASVDTAVKAGDLKAQPFGGSKSGLLQSFTWNGKGKYTLRVRLGAGDLELK
jgi:hypothetical protein